MTCSFMEIFSTINWYLIGLWLVSVAFVWRQGYLSGVSEGSRQIFHGVRGIAPISKRSSED